MHFSPHIRSQLFKNAGIERVLKVGVLVLLFVIGPMSQAQNAPTKEAADEFTWKNASGAVRSLSDLQEILLQHKQWLDSKGKSGIKANLSYAALTGANLVDANLRGANLAHTDFIFANLTSADLSDANLTDANLTGATLANADLSDADLTRVGLFRSNLSESKLVNATLKKARLHEAKLTNVSLDQANLTEADLSEADLNGVWIGGANLNRTIFEPSSLAGLRGVSQAVNLEFLSYSESPSALVQLRKQFEDGGFREQEQKITYALKRREAELSCERCRSRKISDSETRAILWSSDSTLANCGSFVLNTAFFDWTCQYGMSPGRPLVLGVFVWLLCSFLYLACAHTSGEAGLYRVYAPGVYDDPKAPPRVERISPLRTEGPKTWGSILRRFWAELLLLRTSMFFSLMSAFNIGFRDVNFGRWLRLLTRQEFDIKAVGWARVVAGWQSLISVFLIALWILTYFGRPFN